MSWFTLWLISMPVCGLIIALFGPSKNANEGEFLLAFFIGGILSIVIIPLLLIGLFGQLLKWARNKVS